MKKANLKISMTIAAMLVAVPVAHAGSSTATVREQRAAAAQAALVSIAQELEVFAYGSQQWMSGNLQAEWNQYGTTTALPPGGPILLYAGNALMCGTPAGGVGYSQKVDLTQTTLLPSGFAVPMSGADCGVVYPHANTMTSKGVTIGVNLLAAFFSPNTAALAAPGSLLSNMTPSYVTNKVTSIVATMQNTPGTKSIYSNGKWVLK